MVTTCKTSCYLVPAESAVKLGLVGEKAQACLRLPHPEKCPANDDFFKFIMRLPPSQ